MARKRDEKVAKAAHKKERKAKYSPSKEEHLNFVGFNNQLATLGLELREIPGDGNCLFRALGDQLEGHTHKHQQHREDTVEYMRQYRKDFEPFIEDDIPFDSYVKNLQEMGTYAGNDAIVAFARRNGVTVVIHQLNSPMWKIHGGDESKSQRELHIAYHNGDHYNSIRRLGDNSQEPANIHLNIDDKLEHNDSSCKPVFKNKSINNVSDDEDSPYSDKIHLVMARSGCGDVILVEQTLEDYHQNVEATIDCLINLALVTNCDLKNETNLWDENGTGTRIFGELNNGCGENGVKQKRPKPINQKNETKKHLSNRQRQDQKRRERKETKNTRRKYEKSLSGSSDSDSVDCAVQKFGCLTI